MILFSLQSVPPLETFALSWLKLAGAHVRALLVGKKCSKVSLGGNIAEHILPNTVGHVAKLFECQYVADDLRYRDGGERMWCLKMKIYLRPVDWRNLALVSAEDFSNFSPPSRVVIHPVNCKQFMLFKTYLAYNIPFHQEQVAFCSDLQNWPRSIQPHQPATKQSQSRR